MSGGCAPSSKPIQMFYVEEVKSLYLVEGSIITMMAPKPGCMLGLPGECRFLALCNKVVLRSDKEFSKEPSEERLLCPRRTTTEISTDGFQEKEILPIRRQLTYNVMDDTPSGNSGHDVMGRNVKIEKGVRIMKKFHCILGLAINGSYQIKAYIE